MPLYTRKELCEKYGIKSATLRQHIKRGRVIEENGRIDDSNDKNKKYLAEQGIDVIKRQPLVNLRKSNAPVDPKTVTKPKKTPEQRQKEKEHKEQQNYLNSLVVRKEKAATELKEREAELKRIDIEKKAGNLLPIELVQKIIQINNKTIFVNMEQEIRNQAAIMAKDREELAILETNMQKTLKTTIEKAKADMLAELKAAVNEFMNVRGVGQSS